LLFLLLLFLMLYLKIQLFVRTKSLKAYVFFF
jgi:hypothetical protein